MHQSLSGTWQCALPDGRAFALMVPGCWDTYIEEKDLCGPVRLSRRFSVPDAADARWILRFHRVSYACEVYINGTLCGAHEGMWDAFTVDISACVHKGDNEVALLVTKPGYSDADRFPLRQVLSGFIPDVLCTFGGIWGGVTLLRADRFIVNSHAARGGKDGVFRLTVVLSGEVLCTLCARVFDANGRQIWQEQAQGGGEVTLRGALPDPHAWSPHDPYLYRYAIDIECDGQTKMISGALGLRDIASEDTRLLLNGEPVYLRGALHWGLYDIRIIPVPTHDEIERELSGLRAYGFNAVKHCLYIPSDEYLSACDRAGILCWIELPLWLPEKTDELEGRIRREYPVILRALSGHPSVILVSLGCELNTVIGSALLREMYETAHALTDALVCDNSGSGECYGGSTERSADFFDYHFYGDLQNMEPLMEHFTPAWRNRQPWIFGEFCDSDTLRDLARVRADYGVERLFWEGNDPHKNPISILKPDFYAHHHDECMKASGIGGQFDRLHALSINHSLTHRKITLEMTRAFPEICGYNVTSIRDMPLTADGLFDEIGRAKFSQEIFRQANDSMVLCPAWDLTRIWICGDRVQPKERYSFFGGQETGLHVLLSNYGAQEVDTAVLRWRLSDGDRTLASGEHRACLRVPVGSVCEVGSVRVTLPQVDEPATLRLHVELNANGAVVRNAWPVFVYPEPRPNTASIGLFDPTGLLGGIESLYNMVDILEDEENCRVQAVVATHLSAPLLRYVERGGRVFLLQRGLRCALPTASLSFWREGLIDREGTHFLGELPYRDFDDDLRYFGVATDSIFDLNRLEGAGFPDYEEWMTRYDCRTWLRGAYVLSMPRGEGMILATTLRLEGGMGKQPDGIRENVFGRWFLDAGLRWLSKGAEI